MTLRDKFKKCKDKSNTYYVLPIADDAEQLEKIADVYAIEFAEWFINNGVEFYDNTSKGNVYKYINDLKFYTIKELLQIFKKEKGL